MKNECREKWQKSCLFLSRVFTFVEHTVVRRFENTVWYGNLNVCSDAFIYYDSGTGFMCAQCKCVKISCFFSHHVVALSKCREMCEQCHYYIPNHRVKWCVAIIIVNLAISPCIAFAWNASRTFKCMGFFFWLYVFNYFLSLVHTSNFTLLALLPRASQYK